MTGNPWERVMGGQKLGLFGSLSPDARYRKMHSKYLLEERMTIGRWEIREHVSAAREISRAVRLSWNLGFPESYLREPWVSYCAFLASVCLSVQGVTC